MLVLSLCCQDRMKGILGKSLVPLELLVERVVYIVDSRSPLVN